MKKQYINPITEIQEIQIGYQVMAGSTGDISNVSISDTETISDVGEFGSRQQSNVWDDEENEEEW